MEDRERRGAAAEDAGFVRKERGVSVAKSSVKKPSKARAQAKKSPPSKLAAKSSSVVLAPGKSSKSKLPAPKSAAAKPPGSKLASKSASKAAARGPVSPPPKQVIITAAPGKSFAALDKSTRIIAKAARLAKKNDHPPRSEPVSVPAPVPTDGKPRKNQAGLSSRELEYYRELLLAKRRELVGDMSSMEREALRSTTGTNLSNLPLHMADMGTDNYEQEFTLGLVEKERHLLREINQALAKIMDGTYGICEGTGKPIGKVRLEVQPWAKYSIEFARQKEKGFIR